MFDIGEKIKKVSLIVLIIQELSGAFWFIESLGTYLKNKDHTYLTEYVLQAQLAIPQIIISLAVMFSGVIIFFMMYGFGNLISNSDTMVHHIEEIYYHIVEEEEEE